MAFASFVKSNVEKRQKQNGWKKRSKVLLEYHEKSKKYQEQTITTRS